MENRIKFIFFVLLVNLTSCYYNEIFDNREEDKAAGEVVINQFYLFLSLQKDDKVIALLSKDFLKKTRTNQMLRICEEYRNMGEIRLRILKNYQTHIVEGTNPVYDYAYNFEVTRDSVITIEQFRLTKENNRIKIFGFSVNEKQK